MYAGMNNASIQERSARRRALRQRCTCIYVYTYTDVYVRPVNDGHSSEWDQSD